MTEISYRAGTFSSFYERALDLMSEPTINGEENPLARINHGRDDGIVQSFAAAWAVLGDILTFYQERIINEGYLRTATEEFSVRNIVALLDYVPRPALSARTVLCLTVAPAPGGASNLTIPAHTQIMSLPAAGSFRWCLKPTHRWLRVTAGMHAPRYARRRRRSRCSTARQRRCVSTASLPVYARG